MARKVSLAKVAKAAGVSPATVSRVLNGHPNIAEDTRQRTQAAIDELGYEPDERLQRFFRQIHKGCQSTVILVDPTISRNAGHAGAFYWRLLWSVQRKLQERGQHTILATSDHGILADGQLYAVAEGLADGIIAKVHNESTIAKLAQHSPLVLFYVNVRLPKVDCVLPDVHRAARQQVEYLAALGHQRIGMFRLTSDDNWQDRDFWWSYRHTCRDLGLTIPEVRKPIDFGLNEHPQAVRDYLDWALAADDRPTAILTFDTYASEVIRQLQDRGLRVPHDISVVGFDDDLVTDPSPVPVTTFRQNFDLMAATAVELLDERKMTPDRPSRIIQIEGDMIERKSAGPAPIPG